jgi:hypothetical protein
MDAPYQKVGIEVIQLVRVLNRMVWLLLTNKFMGFAKKRYFEAM